MADLTFMIIRSTGKTHSFGISSRFLVWSSLLVVFYLIGSLVVIYECLGLWRMNMKRSTQITYLEHEIFVMKRALQRTNQQLSQLNNAAQDLQATGESQTEAGKLKGLDSKSVPVGAENSPVEKNRDNPKETFVDISDFIVNRNGSFMDVFFKVINLRQDGAAISGYIHVIAINPTSDPPKLWPYPKTTLQNGIPVDYTQGESFKIHRFRIMKGSYSFESKTEGPSLIKVLVYDKLGNLLLQRNFDEEDIT